MTPIILGLSLGAVNAATPVRKEIPVQKVYTPEGFNSNENSQIVVTGTLPNLCHKSPLVKKQITDKEIKIELTSLSYDVTNTYCPEAILPFEKTIDLGELEEGNYNVVINEGTQVQQEEKLIVESADPVNGNENLIYANITDIQISEDDPTAIRLKAYNPSTCFEIDEIKINSDQNGTYTVSPILKQRDEFCAYKMVPFDIDIKLPIQEGDENILLHVKTMDGDSINRIINPQQI